MSKYRLLDVARFIVHPSPSTPERPPEWLRSEGPDRDVVLSTRVRVMRNLAGHRFPNKATKAELENIADSIAAAASECAHRPPREWRDTWVAWRLVPARFPWGEPGRAVLSNEALSLVCLINEEDHLRVQSIAPGLAVAEVECLAEGFVSRLAGSLPFASSQERGYLGASPYNCGNGRRTSVVAHLVGLQASRRLSTLIQAISSQGFVARGAFGESSKVVGALLQISDVRDQPVAFEALVRSVVTQERIARVRAVNQLSELSDRAADSLRTHHMLSLPDALAILSLARWSLSRDSDARFAPIDTLLGGCEPTATAGDRAAARRRHAFLRERLEVLD